MPHIWVWLIAVWFNVVVVSSLCVFAFGFCSFVVLLVLVFVVCMCLVLHLTPQLSSMSNGSRGPVLIV